MLRKTLLAFAALVGGAVAGCAVEADEPIVVMGHLDCVEAASLLGVELGNQEFELPVPVPTTYHLDQLNPEEFSLRPVDRGAHLEWAASLGVHAILVDRAPATELHLYDPAVTGSFELMDSMDHNGGKRPLAFRICWGPPR